MTEKETLYQKYEKTKSFLCKHSDRIAFIISLAYIVIFAIVLLERSFDIGIRYHEIDSYALPTISLQYRFSFTMNPGDLLLAQRDFPELYSGINCFEDLRSSRLLQATSNPDIWLAYYFPIYSLTALPVKLIYQLFGLPQYQSFIVTNVLLIVTAFAVILFCSKMPKWYRFAFILILSAAPLEQYTTYIGAEIMMYAFMAMAITFYYDKAYCRAGLMLSLTSLANPSVLFFGLLMIANYAITEVFLYYKSRKDLSAKQICWQGFLKLARLGVCYLIVFIPFILNFIYLKTANGTFVMANLTTLWKRFLMYIFDINLGFSSFAPLTMLFVIIILPFVIKSKKTRLFWMYGAFFIAVFSYSIVFHINCGMFYTARYVIWSFPLLALLFIAIIAEMKLHKYAKPSIVAACAVSASALIGFNYAQNVSYTHLNRLSQVVLDNAPALYSPLHSTFYSRAVNNPHGGYDLPPLTVYYSSNSNQIRKILIQGTEEAKTELFSKYTVIEGNSEKYISDINSIPNDNEWHYFNISPSSDYQVRLTTYEFGVEGMGATPGCTKDANIITVIPGGAQFGPYAKLSPGEYLVAIYGDNLTDTQNDAAYNLGRHVVECTTLERRDGVIVIKLKLDKCGYDTDIRTYNTGEEDIIISGLKIVRINNADELEAVKSQLLGE